ncbi:hypothetical protein LVD15_09580 [Fulvivirga maritima]|uniref:DUF6503 family protein n=1 Tax=Fulvivirga maritima TaxID=2904247 RepID=UPI001F3124AF|nr:DUF6503 family protein [Fulvivirga maritima]UII28654.1 hypothetical protein LVD15_09580 [Fulvivirga maritima]
MKHALLALIIIASISATSCHEPSKGEELINKTIEVMGMKSLNGKMVEFSFRDKEYGAKFNNGQYQYIRLFKQDNDLIRDVLTNDSFKRYINGALAETPDSTAAKYSNSVNSVIYFALLPYGLDQEAVVKEYLKETTIKGQAYHKVKVTFREDGGGEDYNDIFLYWINTANLKIDFLAYKYHSDGGGMRFRKAYNERQIEGITFLDYYNFQPSSTINFMNIDQAYENEELEKDIRN